MGSFETFDIRKCVTDSVMDTYSTMLSMRIEPTDEETQLEASMHRMVGTLHFAGAITGIFNLQVSVDFGRIMAASMLDIEPAEVDLTSDVRDLIAEITNIVGGNLKSALNDDGNFCVLSTPSISYGTDFTIKSLATMDRLERCVFRKDDHQLTIEVGLKAGGDAGTGISPSAAEAMDPVRNVDLEKLNPVDYQANVSEAMINVFDTMFSFRLEAAEMVSSASLHGLRNVSSVCFAGDATGIVSIHIDRELSRRMTAVLVGLPPDEIKGEDEIQDMLGELGNMVGGSLKSLLTDIGLRCTLSTPSVTSGSDFMIETMNLDRYERIAFHTDGHSVFVELGIKIAEGITAAAPTEKNIYYQVENSDTAPEPAPAGAADPPTTPISGRDVGEQPTWESVSAPPPPKHQPETPFAKTAHSPEDFGLDLLVDIPVELTVELGRTKIPIHDLLKLQPGSAVKLERLEGEPVDILANDILIARGEVVVRNEKYGIRITEITRRADRLRGLS